MECSCCNKKRKLLESFAVLNIDNQKFELCSECNNLVFKLRDFSVKKNKKEFDIAQKKILKKCETNNNPTFKKWLDSFIKKMDVSSRLAKKYV